MVGLLQIFWIFWILQVYFNKKCCPAESTLYIASGADPALQISQSIQMDEMHTMDAASLRNVCVLHCSGAHFHFRKTMFEHFVELQYNWKENAQRIRAAHRTFFFNPLEIAPAVAKTIRLRYCFGGC